MVLVFKTCGYHKGQPRYGTVRGRGRPLTEGAASAAVEASQRRPEEKLRVGSIRQSQSPWREPSRGCWWGHILKRRGTTAYWRFQYHGQSSRAAAGGQWRQPEPTRQATCAADGRAKEVRLPRPLWAQSITAGPRCQALNVLWGLVLVCFDMIKTVSQLFLK